MTKVKVAHKPRSTKAKAVPVPVASSNLTVEPTEEQRRAMVSEAAYYRALRRGFEPGRELDDWLAAEAEIAACSLIRDLRPELH